MATFKSLTEYGIATGQNHSITVPLAANDYVFVWANWRAGAAATDDATFPAWLTRVANQTSTTTGGQRIDAELWSGRCPATTAAIAFSLGATSPFGVVAYVMAFTDVAIAEDEVVLGPTDGPFPTYPALDLTGDSIVVFVEMNSLYEFIPATGLVDEVFADELTYSSPNITTTRVRAYSFAGGGSVGPWARGAVISGGAALGLVFALEAPAPVGAIASDRLRSSVSETTGSLLEAVDARAVDASVSEAYTYAQELAGTSLRTFREVLRERDSAVADFAYFPQPRQNIVMENQYTGISVLSRLARYYPPRIFDDVVNLGIAAIPAATATDIIDYVLTQWAAANDWLTFEPVPDLRVPMPGLAPSDYGVGTGQVYAATVTIRQDGANRQDALSILRDLLSPFPGTVVRQNSAGNLEIVPASGPDADETPHVTLTTDDLYSVTIGKPNPFDVINRCTVTASGGLEQGEDVAVMQPAWFQIGSAYQFGRSNWFTPAVARQNLQPFDDPTDTTLQEGLTISSNFNLQKPVLWPISGDAIPAGDGISLVDSGATEMVTISWARYFNDSLVSSGTNGLTIVTDVIPFSGEWVTVFRVDIALPLDDAWLTVQARWNEVQQGVEFRTTPDTKLDTNCSRGCNGVIIEFTLNDASVGYTEGTSVSGTFGFIGDDDTVLPADSASGDAVLDSQTALGIVERTINIKGYAFDAVTLSQIARGYVIQNITPKVTRELDVAALSGYRVLFDDIGRMVQLPNGDLGFLTGVSYTDDFVSKVVRKTATVEVRDLAAAGAIDTTTIYHVLSDGTYWTTEETGLPIAREEQP